MLYNYKLRRQGRLFYLICVDKKKQECRSTQTGCGNSRRIRHTEDVSIIDLLDMLEFRQHIQYQIMYQGVPINPKEWEDLNTKGDFNPFLLDVKIQSQHCPNTLSRFAEHCITHPKLHAKKNHYGNSTSTTKRKYKKPKSKKEVASNWLYTS